MARRKPLTGSLLLVETKKETDIDAAEVQEKPKAAWATWPTILSYPANWDIMKVLARDSSLLVS